MIAEWQLPDGLDCGDAVASVAAEPDVWTDGSLVEDKVSGASSSGSGFSSFLSGHLWAHRRWGHLDDGIGGDRAIGACRDFCSVSGPLQTVQRAEFWVVFLALQAADGIHFGVDNLNVVRHVGRLLDGNVTSRPAELVERMAILLRLLVGCFGLEVWTLFGLLRCKGHADEGMVRNGGVRELDGLGNNAADEAADFGRRRVEFPVIDARRKLAGVCGRWYPVVMILHRILMLSPVVNHVGGDGTAPDPLVWSVGALPKRRRLVHAVPGSRLFAWTGGHLEW